MFGSRRPRGYPDWLIGLLIYRHGLRVSEACDLRWDDIDLPKRTIIVRRLKGSNDSSHYLERDELAGLKLLRKQQEDQGTKSAYVLINERGEAFRRMGIARMIERAGEAAELPFPIHVHMLRHSTGYALAAREWTRGGSSTISAMPPSRTRCAIRPCHRSRSRISGNKHPAAISGPPCLQKANANRFAANVLPVIEQINASGATSLRAIAKLLIRAALRRFAARHRRQRAFAIPLRMT